MLPFNCPKCGEPMSVMMYQLGTTETCPKCNREIPVPTLKDVCRQARDAVRSADGAAEPPTVSRPAASRLAATCAAARIRRSLWPA